MSETRPRRAGRPRRAVWPAGGPRPGLALLVLAAAQLMVVLDATIVTRPPAHPAGARLFRHEPGVGGQRLRAGLRRAAAAAADRGPARRRKMFIAGLLLFSAASLAGGSPTARPSCSRPARVQGVGGALGARPALSLSPPTSPRGPPRNRALGV